MPARAPHIAIIGAGIGGLTAAACLRRAGIDVRIYEQARGFTRLGAGIQQAPNSIRVLYALGLKDKLLAHAFQPESNDSRDHDTGALTNSLPLGRSVLERHGVPYFLMHRGDLHAMLAELVPQDVIRLNHKLAGLDQAPDGSVRLTFTHGDTAQADAVIGADGVHSVVREFMLGKDNPASPAASPTAQYFRPLDLAASSRIHASNGGAPTARAIG
jgi:6-hydroxynicotinate 3-monooxygenase